MIQSTNPALDAGSRPHSAGRLEAAGQLLAASFLRQRILDPRLVADIGEKPLQGS
jgi:hypothetical protein